MPVLIQIAKYIIISFGLFFIMAGLYMLFKPGNARAIVQKAGSTPFINYAELIIRMIPAIALIIFADYGRYPGIFTVAGWFMIGTSVLLLMVTPSTHHHIANRFAFFLKPLYFQVISPFSILLGLWLIYAVR